MKRKLEMKEEDVHTGRVSRQIRTGLKSAARDREWSKAPRDVQGHASAASSCWAACSLTIFAN